MAGYSAILNVVMTWIAAYAAKKGQPDQQAG